MPNRTPPTHKASRKDQKGVVLVIVLILLGLLSLLAASNLRNAQSTEGIAGNTRTTELASQAAEMALRHCEASVMKLMALSNGDTLSTIASYPTSFTLANIHPIISPPDWQDAKGKWDVLSDHVFVLPLSLLGQPSPYKRAPECMVESINVLAPSPVLPDPGLAPVANEQSSNFIITVRGFGPEVALADPQRLRPIGTEVWLQTHLSLRKNIQTLKSRSWRQVFLR